MEYLYGQIDDDVIIEICKRRNIRLPEDLREGEECEDTEEIEEDEPLDEVDPSEDCFDFEPPVPKLGFFGTLFAVLVGASAVSNRRKPHNGRCDGDCANCPQHYGYRYGQWYYGHDHIYGCELGGNKASGSMD